MKKCLSKYVSKNMFKDPFENIGKSYISESPLHPQLAKILIKPP